MSYARLAASLFGGCAACDPQRNLRGPSRPSRLGPRIISSRRSRKECSSSTHPPFVLRAMGAVMKFIQYGNFKFTPQLAMNVVLMDALQRGAISVASMGCSGSDVLASLDGTFFEQMPALEGMKTAAKGSMLMSSHEETRQLMQYCSEHPRS